MHALISFDMIWYGLLCLLYLFEAWYKTLVWFVLNMVLQQQQPKVLAAKFIVLRFFLILVLKLTFETNKLYCHEWLFFYVAAILRSIRCIPHN